MAIIDTRDPITSTTQSARNIDEIMGLIGKREKVRQDRSLTNRFVARALELEGEGLERDEATRQAATEVTNAPTQFDEGIEGFLQRVAAGTLPKGKSTLLTGPVAEQNLQEPSGSRRDLIKAQITGQESLAKRRESLNAEAAKKKEGKTAETGGLSKETVIKALPDIFNKAVSKAPKVKRKGTKFDKVFGADAYRQLAQSTLDQKDKLGLSTTETLNELNKWWDAQFAKEKGQRFQKFQDRKEFDTKAIEGLAGEELTPEEQAAKDQIDPTIFDEIQAAVDDGTISGEELKIIEDGLLADPTKAEQVLQRIKNLKGK